MWEYCDTSALVKRYVDELGRPELMRLLRKYDCVTSALSLVELKGALRRRVAARHVAGVRVPELLTHVVEDRSYWTLVEVGAEVLRGAEALLSIYAVGTMGAIHLASAQLLASRVSAGRVTFVTAHEHQAEVASAIGLATRVIGSSR